MLLLSGIIPSVAILSVVWLRAMAPVLAEPICNRLAIFVLPEKFYYEQTL
jgi:hypothetical protein